MDPAQTGRNYDRIADRWRAVHTNSGYGVEQLERAINFVVKPGLALDVGCGSSGRFIKFLLQAGFEVEGMDISGEMLKLAREIHAEVEFYQGDISSWVFPKQYDFICAWDSTFHLPLNMQEPALRNMANGLNDHGLLIFTLGGTEEPGEITDSFEGEDFEYSSLGIKRTLSLLNELGLTCLHLEFDQGSAQQHVYIIARK